jgi:hypothetical protein
VIHIEHEDAKGCVGAQAAFDFGAELIEESGAIPQAGENIMGGLVAKFFLGGEEIALQEEDFGEGLAFLLMGSFGLQPERLSFAELGEDDARLSAHATA